MGPCRSFSSLPNSEPGESSGAVEGGETLQGEGGPSWLEAEGKVGAEGTCAKGTRAKADAPGMRHRPGV